MLPQGVNPGYTTAIQDDFTELDPNRWVGGDDGTTVTDAVANVSGGWLNLPTAAVAESYRERHSPSAIFSPAVGRHVVAEIQLKLTEANGNQAGLFFGLTDNLTTGFLTDASHVPPATWDGVVFFKKPGTSVWQVMLSNGTTRQTLSNAGAFVSGAEVNLRLELSVNKVGTEVFPGISYNVQTRAFLNGVDVIPSGRHVTFNVPLPNFSMLRLAFGVKAGSSSTETLMVDAVSAFSPR